MNTLFSWFNQPYPIDNQPKSIVRWAFLGFGAVFLLLYILRPFGSSIAEGQEMQYFYVCFVFAAITFCIFLGVAFGSRLFPTVFIEEKWTVWKEALFNLFMVSCIAIGNMIYWALSNDMGIGLRAFGAWLWMTWSVGVFPVLLGILLKYNKWNTQYVEEAAHIAGHIQAKPHSIAVKPYILLRGDNQNEQLELSMDSLLFMTAADNYVQVFFEKNEAVEHQMLRSTLKKMEAQLSEFPQVFRCHRTWLVNLKKVVDLSGNAQGYKLHFKGTDRLIPVSRSLNASIKKRLK